MKQMNRADFLKGGIAAIVGGLAVNASAEKSAKKQENTGKKNKPVARYTNVSIYSIDRETLYVQKGEVAYPQPYAVITIKFDFKHRPNKEKRLDPSTNTRKPFSRGKIIVHKRDYERFILFSDIIARTGDRITFSYTPEKSLTKNEANDYLGAAILEEINLGNIDGIIESYDLLK
jgi:hypothetical protein